MTLEQIERRLKNLVEGDVRKGRIIILDHKCDNKILRFLESFPTARRVNNIFEATASEVFRTMGATDLALQELRIRCTPQSGTNFDYDSPTFSTLFTMDYIFIPENFDAIEYMASALGKNYVAIVDYSPQLASFKEDGCEIIHYC